MDLNEMISANFKAIRNARNLSLDEVSRLTGVSKSMLGQIERGEVNPTITTVWKITNGLKISFSSMVSRPKSSVEVVRKGECQPFVEEGIKNYPIFPFEEIRRFETYQVEMEPGSVLTSDAHLQGAQEFITIFSGILVIQVEDREYTITDGDSIRFNGDVPHVYRNTGEVTVRMSMVIYYEK